MEKEPGNTQTVASHTPVSPRRTSWHPALTGKQKRKDSPLDRRGAALHDRLENVHKEGQQTGKRIDFGTNTQLCAFVYVCALPLVFDNYLEFRLISVTSPDCIKYGRHP